MSKLYEFLRNDIFFYLTTYMYIVLFRNIKGAYFANKMCDQVSKTVAMWYYQVYICLDFWTSYMYLQGIQNFCNFVDALSDILDALKEGENFQRLEEAKQSAGNDMLRTMQIVFPVATNIQMEVIERYGFPSDGEGEYFLIQQLDQLQYVQC